MALILALDPTQIEAGAARGKSALDLLKDAAGRTEGALGAVSFAPVAAGANTAAQTFTAFGQTSTDLVAAQNSLSGAVNTLSVDMARLAGVQATSAQDAARIAAGANTAAQTFTTFGQTSTALVAAQNALSVSVNTLSVDMARLAGVQATSAEKAARIAAEATQEADAFQRLKASLDPAYAAALRFEEAQAQVNRALQAGVIDSAEAARAVGLAEAALQRASGGAGMAARAMGEVGGASRNVGFAVQNAAFQIGDFAVQVASGTSAVRAMGMQLPQLLGGFGVWGAVIGGAVAVLGALAPALLDVGDKAQAAADRVDDLQTALADYINYAKTATAQTDVLRGQFGQFAEEIRQHAAFLANVAVSNATRDLTDASLSFSVALDQVIAKQKVAQEAAVAYGKAYADLKNSGYGSPDTVKTFEDQAAAAADSAEAAAKAIGLTQDQARQLKAALDALATDGGGGLAEVHSEAAKANALLVQMTANGQNIGPALADLAAKMYDLETKSAEALGLQQQMPGALNNAAGAADGLAGAMGGAAAAVETVANANMAGGIAAAIGPAQSLAGYLTAAARAAWDAAGARRAALDPTSSGYLANQYSQYGQGHSAMDRATDPLYNPPPPPGAHGGGGGGGGGADPIAETQKAYDALMASLDPAVEASQKLADAQKTINGEFANGAITEAEHARALALVAQKYGQAADAADALKTAGGNAIDGLIDGTKTLSEALRDMAKELVMATAKAQLLQHVTGGTASMSIGGLIVQGLFGGFHDAGGTIPNGTTGIVGEYGPELVKATPSGAMVTSRVDTARMIQQAPRRADPVEVRVSVAVDQSGNLQAYVQNVARQSAAQSVQTVKRNLAAWNSQLANDGALA